MAMVRNMTRPATRSRGAGRAATRLRVGRARPKPSSPAWGALRDFPRVACPHLDAHPGDGRSDVLVPDARSDSNLVLGQIHVLWSLLHNAAVSRLAERMAPEAAFATAQRITRGVYRDVIRHDLLGTWLMPRFRARYAARHARAAGGRQLPRAEGILMAGVGRVGHGLVLRDLCPERQRRGRRAAYLLRHTSSGRPHEMPLTEAWLVDFSRFFAIGLPRRPSAPGRSGRTSRDPSPPAFAKSFSACHDLMTH